MNIILVAAIVSATFIILNILKVILNKYSRRSNFLRLAERKFPMVISVLWLLVFVWAVHFLFNNGAYFKLVATCSVIILSLLAGWYFFKDFIAGIVFRGQNRFVTGDIIQFGDIDGIIESFSLTHVSLQTKEGKLLKIPFSRLSSEIISLNTSSKTFHSDIFVLSTNKKETKKETEIAIWNFLMASPWRISSVSPEVRLEDEDETSYYFEIHIQVRNSDHLNYLTDVLEKRFGKIIPGEKLS